MVTIGKITDHELSVNGQNIKRFSYDQRTGVVATDISNIPPNPSSVIHEGTPYQHIEGEFEDGIVYTAIHEGDYLTFRNGAKFINYGVAQ